MSRKAKFTADTKIKACEDFINALGGSCQEVCRKINNMVFSY